MPCFDPRSAASFCNRSMRRAVSTRLAPPAASNLASLSPIPALAPVIRAHLPRHSCCHFSATTSSDPSNAWLRRRQGKLYHSAALLIQADERERREGPWHVSG